MPVFSYTAIDQSGRELHGSLEAPTEDSLDALLRRRGQWLTRAEASTRRSLARQGGHAVSRRVMADFYLQLAMQLRAGIAIDTALEFYTRHDPGSKLSPVLDDVVLRLKSGTSFSEAMTLHPRTFGAMAVNVFRAGEASGRMKEACDEMRKHLEWTDRIIADARQAMVYPCFVAVSAGLFMILVFNFMVPRFATMLTDLKVPLPALTKWVLAISKFTVANGPALLGSALGLLALGFFLHRRFPAVAYHLDALKLRLPVFGPVIHMVALSRFTQNMALLFRSGIPLLDTLQFCRQLVGNRVVAHSIDLVRERVNRGSSISDAMSDQPVFPGLVLQMVSVGEISGALDESLQNAADYYNEALPRRIKKVISLLEPCMILGLILAVGIIALAIMLPIAELLGKR